MFGCCTFCTAIRAARGHENPLMLHCIEAGGHVVSCSIHVWAWVSTDSAVRVSFCLYHSQTSPPNKRAPAAAAAIRPAVVFAKVWISTLEFLILYLKGDALPNGAACRRLARFTCWRRGCGKTEMWIKAETCPDCEDSPRRAFIGWIPLSLDGV